MNFVIRKMLEEDTKQVQGVAKTSWHATYDGIIPFVVQDSFLNMAYSDESMKRRLERSHLFVGESDGGVVGFANFSPVRDDGKVELGAIYLLPTYQGKGIGTALIQKGVEDLPGIKEIFINVEKDNTVGLTFYRAKGFEVVKEFDDEFDGHILKTVRMVLKV